MSQSPTQPAPAGIPVRNAVLPSVSQLAVMLAMMILLLGLYDHYRYRPVMTVDVDLIMQNKMNALQKQLSASPDGTFSKEDMLNQSRTWATELADQVKTLSTEYNALVLVRPAVVEGAIDMTGTVMNNLK